MEKAAYPMFYRRVEKKLARDQRKDFQHKLSSSLEEIYDAVCVEDLSLKAMAEDSISEKVYMTMDMGSFLPCWSISWKNEGNIWSK